MMYNKDLKTKILVAKKYVIPKNVCWKYLIFFLVNINCQILRFQSNPIVPSNIVFADILRGFLPFTGQNNL